MSKTIAPILKFEDLKKGQVYRSRKPKMVGPFRDLVDDRQILHISEFKCNMGHIDHGYTKEYDEWCAKKSGLIFKSSENTMIEFENETNLSAKNIETIWDYAVQYDSPTVKNGKNYPRVTATKFLEWTEKNVTEIMPQGKWADKL